MAEFEIEHEIKKDINTKTAIRPPKKFNVILHNDDVTSMEFVIEVLMTIFGKSAEDAYRLMLRIHNMGKGIAGTYGFETANQKKYDTIVCARQCNYPLVCTIEEVL